MTIKAIKEESLKLDKADRKELAYFLLDSIFEEGLVAEPLPPSEQEAEVERRYQLFKEGKISTHSWSEVKKDLISRHSLDSSL